MWVSSCLYEQKMKSKNGTLVLSYGWKNIVATVASVIKAYSLHPLKIPRYNSHHVNGCVGVEHEENSLDYWTLRDAINQCEVISPLMTVHAKVPKYILWSATKGVDIKSLARSFNQGTLMHSHDCQRGNLPLRHADSKVH